MDQVLIDSFDIAGVVQIDRHLVDLLILSCENERVLT